MRISLETNETENSVETNEVSERENIVETNNANEIENGVEANEVNDTENVQSNRTNDNHSTEGNNEETNGEQSESAVGGETMEASEESLTFDENHFSTPVGGASPARSPSRRRRTTTSSMEDSEVRGRVACAAECTMLVQTLHAVT